MTPRTESEPAVTEPGKWSASHVGNIGVLTFCNPPYNFLTFASMSDLNRQLALMSDDHDVHVVVLRSDTPGYFAAHADLEDLDRLAARSLTEPGAFTLALGRVESMPQPVIAAIDGQAWGGGLELALACTLRWASENANFRMLETSLGMIPGAGGTQRLPRLIGLAAAAEVILGGETMTADKALHIGLIGRMLPHNDFHHHVIAAASAVAVSPRRALVGAKQALMQGSELPLSDALRLEGRICGELLTTPESTALRRHARQEYEQMPIDS